MAIKFLHTNLAFLRQCEGLSQADLVSDIETFQGVAISRSAYGSYEENRNEPRLIVVKAIADYYEISIDDLCFKNLCANG